jgi:hypothetical protein
MKYKKHRRKTGGREKGTPNKRTQQWEIFSDWFMSQGMERLEEELGKLEGKDYVNTVRDLLEYFQPKLARQELVGGRDEKDLPIPILPISLFEASSSND